MAKKTKLNRGHFHEVMDRIHVINSNIDDHIISHPVLSDKKYKKLKKKAVKAQCHLMDIYTEMGRIIV